MRTPVPMVQVVLLVLLSAGGCATSTPQGGWPPPDLTEFVIMRGDSVVATERTARTLEQLTGEIEMPGVARARYVATLSGIGTLTRLETSTRPWSGAGEQVVSVDMLQDSLVVRSSEWAGLPQTFAERAGNAYLHPSPALLELIVRRALLSTDSVADVRVWLLNQNAAATARVAPAPDGRLRVELAGTAVYLVHENGHLLTAEVPSLGWVVRRR